MTEAFRLTRRGVVAGGLLAGAVAPAATAAPVDLSAYETARWATGRAFTTGPLADNPIAKRFMPPKGEMLWPAVPLLGPKGRQTLADWRGKTLLVTLWAEWCAPCLAEMPGLAKVNAKFRSRSFEVLPIVSGSHTIASVEDAHKRLALVKGADIVSLVDASPNGDALRNSLGEANSEGMHLPPGSTLSGGVLPCLVIVDPAGRVRARAFGGPSPGERDDWQTGTGEAFVKLLAEGAAST